MENKSTGKVVTETMVTTTFVNGAMNKQRMTQVLREETEKGTNYTRIEWERVRLPGSKCD